MTSVRLCEHEGHISLATITEVNRLLESQAAEIAALKAQLPARICNICNATGVVHGLYNWRTGGTRSEKCWNCHPAPEGHGRAALEAIASLESERAANHMLTNEVEALKETLATFRPPFDPSVFTVFCRESSDTGTTWIDTVRVDPTSRTAEQLLEDIKLMAVLNCAADWGWEDTSGITCYCIIPGEPGVLFFEDLGT